MNMKICYLFIMAFYIPARIVAQSEEDPNNELVKPKQEITTNWNNITFLNASNFDFNNDLQGSYLGKINIFAPDILGSPFGFNSGIMRIKFNYTDTTNNPLYFENLLINPLQAKNHGEKYLKQLNQHATSRSNIAWSFYLQPMLRIVSYPWPKNKNGKDNIERIRNRKPKPNSIVPNGIYFHLHGELLVNNTNVRTNISTIYQDTLTIDTLQNLTYISYQKNPLIFDKAFLNGYFGAGLTFNIDPFSNGNSRFFFQFTLGKTTNYPNWSSQEISTTPINVVTNSAGIITQEYEKITTGSFYLVRAEFAQMLSDNSQIIIGADIRGLFPRYSPLYATYLGININLDALVKVFSDKE